MWCFYLLLAFISSVQGLSPVSSENFCSIYGDCGRKSLFGSKLPCPDSRAAVDLEDDDATVLSELCGAEWLNSKVCCTREQIDALKDNLKQAEALISSCPACNKNFKEVFCQFTCSPNQSLFINVTKTQKSIEGENIVAELDYFMSEDMASAIFDSCKDIKFSATNGYAIDLLGGGAKNYSQFFKFLGDEKPLLGGSPFQINFRYDDGTKNHRYLDKRVYKCNGTEFACACSDCPQICPDLTPITHNICKVGVLPCFSFSVIIIYSAIISLIAGVYGYKSKTKKIQLLQESPYLRSTGNDLSEVAMRNEVYSVNTVLEKWFSQLAFYCATYPLIVLTLTLMITGALSSFIYFFGSLEKDPVHLWVSSSAEAYKQKKYYDENFGAFYRTEQIFIVNEDYVLTDAVVEWWAEKETEIKSMIVDDIQLDDLCFKPSEDYTCVVESFTEYFNGDVPRDWRKKLKECTDTPVNCLPSFQQPLKKELLFGGYREEDIFTSKAIVITFLLNNDHSNEINATKWENALESYLIGLNPPEGTRISFNTEPSLTLELNKSTNTDTRIVIISYLVMFFYASLSLGGSLKITKTRFSIGLSGIVIVLLSVTSSAGAFSLLGVKSTLIIAEVIPFLILAVGVDNIFLITHELKIINYAYPNESVPFRISKTVGRMGPSILLSATSQFLTFLIASIISMPAVRNFALYSAGAVLLNSILQMTAFISLLSLDQARIDDGRLDLFPCIKFQRSVRLDEIGELFESENEGHFFDKVVSFYGPIILKHKMLIISVFGALTGISMALLPRIKLGLDQTIALPNDSHLIDYFRDLESYFNAGPPVYFVVSGLNVTDTHNQKKLCGKFTTCDHFSLSNILEQERKRSNISTIAEPVASWIDDYLSFLNPELDDCCRQKKDSEDICPPSASSRQCRACFADKPWDYSMEGFPEGDEFMKYLKIWINTPSDNCPLGGKAPYSNAISFDEDGVISSTFRTSHTPLRTQDDYIAAYEESLRIVKELKESLEHEDIFAYSPFYIFFVQYTTILKLTFALIGAALLIIIFNSSVLLGSIRSAFAMVITVIMILINIGGIMSVWNISLNAASLVNLIICVGLAVEFCVHITRAFVISDRDSRLNNVDFRAYNSLVGIGSVVFGGIATTKLIGVIVLAFTQSKIFEVYYFRMWLSLVIVASVHALVFLPVLLSVFGGKRYVFSETGSGIADDIASRLNELE